MSRDTKISEVTADFARLERFRRAQERQEGLWTPKGQWRAPGPTDERAGKVITGTINGKPVEELYPPPSTPKPRLPQLGSIPFPYDDSGRVYTLQELEEWERADRLGREEYRRRQGGGGTVHVRAYDRVRQGDHEHVDAYDRDPPQRG